MNTPKQCMLTLERTALENLMKQYFFDDDMSLKDEGEREKIEYNEAFDDAICNYIFASRDRGLDPNDCNWETLTLNYVVGIASDVKCDLYQTLEIMRTNNLHELPVTYQTNDSDYLSNYFQFAPETRAIVIDKALALVESMEAIQKSLGVQPRH